MDWREVVTSWDNVVAQRRLLKAAPKHEGGGRFSAQPIGALNAFGRIYASWALSQDFYRAGLHLSSLGALELETFLRADGVERFARRPAADLLAQLRTRDAGDTYDDPRFGDDLAAALHSLRTRMLLMPGAIDLCFRVADNEAEMAHLRDAALRPITSIWGYRAGNPAADPTDAAFIRAQVRGWFAAD